MHKNEFDNFFKAVGSRIAKYRKEQGLTQEQLAVKIGITQAVLAYYEKGRRKIPLSLLLPLAKVLYIDIEDILGIEKKKGKSGPVPKIQKKLEEIQNLPLSEQKNILNFLDTIIRGSKQKVS